MTIAKIGRMASFRASRRLSVSSNFNIVVALVSKGDARQLRQLLMMAPALCASLRGPTASALHVAMQHRQRECAEVMLDMGANVNAANAEGLTALHVAVETSFLGGVILLLKNRAKVDARDKRRRTALHLAAASTHPKSESILRCLLEVGACITAEDQQGSSAAHFAAAADNVLVLSFLHGVDAGLIEAVDHHGATPLHHACRNRAMRTMEWLLNNGADADARDENSAIPIVHAARHGHLDIIMKMLSMMEWSIDYKMPGGHTLLMVASQEGNRQLVEQLLANGASPTSVDDLGRCPLIHAAIADAEQCISLLLESNADATVLDVNGHSALMHAACACGTRSVTALLRTAGPDGCLLHAKDAANRSVLMQMLLLPKEFNHSQNRNSHMENDWLKVQQAVKEKEARMAKRREVMCAATGKAGNRLCVSDVVDWRKSGTLSPGTKKQEKEQKIKAFFTAAGFEGIKVGKEHFKTGAAKAAEKAAERVAEKEAVKLSEELADEWSDSPCSPQTKRRRSIEFDKRFLQQMTFGKAEPKDEHETIDFHLGNERGHGELLGIRSKPVSSIWGAQLILKQMLDRTQNMEESAAEICRLLLHLGGGDHGLRLLVDSHVEGEAGPLECAVTTLGNARLLEALLSTPSATSRLLETPELQVQATAAIRHAATLGLSKQISQLLEAGAAVDARPSRDAGSSHEHGCTPLMLAAEHGNLSCVQLLLEQRADTSLTDYRERDCALTLACKHDEPACVQALLSNGADAEAADATGVTGLMACAANGATRSMQVLMEMKADPWRVSDTQASALWYAACEGQEEALQLLLELPGAAHCVNAHATSGLTPLSVAASSNHSRICELLLEARAELEAVDSIGATPLFHAAIRGHSATANLLLRAKANPAHHGTTDSSMLNAVIDAGDEHMAATLIEHGAAHGCVSDTVRRCVGDSDAEPPLVNALRVLLFSDHRPPTTRRTEQDSQIARANSLASSLLKLSFKSVLLASVRAARVMGRCHDPAKLQDMDCIPEAEEAEALCDPRCKWVSDGAISHDVDGPDMWREALIDDEQPIAWWRLLHVALLILELPRIPGDKPSQVWRIHANRRRQLLTRLMNLTEEVEAAFHMVRCLATRRAPYIQQAPFVLEDASHRPHVKAFERLRSRTSSRISRLPKNKMGLAFKALAMRLRLQNDFMPCVREKNASIIRMIMARRELHRTLLTHFDDLEFVPDERHVREANSNEMEYVEHDHSRLWERARSRAVLIGLGRRSNQARARRIDDAEDQSVPKVDADHLQGEVEKKPPRKQLLPLAPPEDDDEHEDERRMFLQLREVLDHGHVLSRDEMTFLRELAARRPCLAISCAMRQTILFPPHLADAERQEILQSVHEASKPEAFPAKCRPAKRASRTLIRFCQICLEYSAVVQSMTWIADSEGVTASAIDINGHHVLHALCQPARPHLLSQFLKFTALATIDALDAEGRSAAALVVQGSSAAQQGCLKEILKVGASFFISDGTLLHEAIRHKQPLQLEILIQIAVARQAEQAEQEKEPLVDELTSTILSTHLLVTHNNGGLTPLSFAVTLSANNCIEALLRGGAPLLSRDRDNRTPLHHAAQLGNIEAVSILLTACPMENRRQLLVVQAGSDDHLCRTREHGGPPNNQVRLIQGESPVSLSVVQQNSSVLNVIMQLTPALWQKESELQLLMNMIHWAVEARSEACVALLMGHCIPLHRRLLQLMHYCVSVSKLEMLPIICARARIHTEHQDNEGNTILHVLCGAADDGSADEGLLRVLLEAQPQLHLFAPDRHGLTALAYAKGGCLKALLEATRRTLREAVLTIVCCRRERVRYEKPAAALTEILTTAFPGLRVKLHPLAGMRPGDEGCPGSFEVLWEAFDWEHSRLLHSRLATGKMPQGEAIIQKVLQLLCGPAMPQKKAAEWHTRIVEPYLHKPRLAPPIRSQAGSNTGDETSRIDRLPSFRTRAVNEEQLDVTLHQRSSEQRAARRVASLPALLGLGGPVTSRTRAALVRDQLYTRDELLQPLSSRFNSSRKQATHTSHDQVVSLPVLRSGTC